MGQQIENEADARRLARAIAADLMLYNEEKVTAGADMSEEVAEGRALFEKRTGGAFPGLYDGVLSTFGGDRRIRFRTEGGGPEVELGAASEPAQKGSDADPWGHDELGRPTGAAGGSAATDQQPAADRFRSFFGESANERASAPESTSAAGTGGTARNPMLVVLIAFVAVGVLLYLLSR